MCEDSVGQVFLYLQNLDFVSQKELLQEVKPVFTTKDNAMLSKAPTRDEVKIFGATSNLHAASGTDGLKSFFNHHCWDVVGPAPKYPMRFTMVIVQLYRKDQLFGSKNLKSTKLSDKNKNFSTKCGLQNCNRYFY